MPSDSEVRQIPFQRWSCLISVTPVAAICQGSRVLPQVLPASSRLDLPIGGQFTEEWLLIRPLSHITQYPLQRLARAQAPVKVPARRKVTITSLSASSEEGSVLISRDGNVQTPWYFQRPPLPPFFFCASTRLAADASVDILGAVASAREEPCQHCGFSVSPHVLTLLSVVDT